MIYVTAAYGEAHARMLTGLARTWGRANKNPLVVYSDLPLALEKPLVLDRTLAKEALEETLPGTPFYTKKILILRNAAEKRGAADVAWIDADSLVFLKTADILVPGRLSGVTYGCPGLLRNCRGGLLVPQIDFFLNGFFAMPSSLLSEWETIVRNHLEEPGEGCPEMEAWNHLAARHKEIVDIIDRKAPDYVWNLPYEHPAPWNDAWCNALGLVRGALAIDGRRVAVLQWVSYALAAHLERGFANVVDGGARHLLRRLYF